MFILYALVIGLLVGAASGGSLAGIAELRIRWGALMLAGLLVQVALFSPAVEEGIGSAGALVYVASTGAVLVAVLRNARIPGFPVVALGAASNAAAILANGGYMPASEGALASLGKVAPTVYSNSSVVPHPVLAPLTDILALPSGLPFANVFSVGDVLIALGVAIVLVAAMRRASVAPATPPDRPADRPAAAAAVAEAALPVGEPTGEPAR